MISQWSELIYLLMIITFIDNFLMPTMKGLWRWTLTLPCYGWLLQYLNADVVAVGCNELYKILK